MKNLILKTVAGAAMKTVNSGKHLHSLSILYQPKMPDQLKKTEK